MPDIIEIQDAPVPEPTQDEFLVDIVDQVAPEEAGPTAADELAIAQARIAALEAQTSQQAPMDELAKQIAALSKPTPVAPTVAPQMDFEGMIKDFNDKFYSNPGENVVNLMTPFLKQMQEQSASKDAEKDVQISRLQLTTNTEQSGLYTKYKDEVEALVATLPPSGNVYQTAVDSVRKNHFDDILTEKASAMAVEIAAKMMQEQGVNTNFTNATGVPTTPPKKEAGTRITVTKSEYADISRWADIKGFPMEDAEDKAWAINYYRGLKGGSK